MTNYNTEVLRELTSLIRDQENKLLRSLNGERRAAVMELARSMDYFAIREMFVRAKRSNCETAFSMIKQKFGERLRSKSQTAQINEVLCKVSCHNLCCLISAIYELGIVPTFWME